MANPTLRAPANEAGEQQPVSPWSCYPCRRRKVRCDRRYPCSLCLKGNLDCSFPISGRTPTRRHDLPSFTPRKEKQEDLLGRLRRLESLVSSFGEEPEGNDSSHRGTRSNPPTAGSRHGLNGRQHEKSDMAHVTHELGTLIMNDNESMYVGNWLWGVICDEIKHIRQSVENDDVASEPLDPSILRSSTESVPFLWGSADISYKILHPLPSQIFFLWETFIDNIDICIKVLHVPTVGRIIKKAKGKFHSMTPGMEALMFAISLAAITSLSEDDVRENFGEEKKVLLARFKLGTEQSLSRAGLLNTTDINTVQAFVIYLEMVKQELGQRASWMLAGLLMRIAAGMGLHRDGSHFPNVSPFDSEIRRRVWYHICFLDACVGDCQVFNIGIDENMFDTKPPSNLDDADITCDMASLPASKDGYTDSTLCILRCRIWHFGREFRTSINVGPRGSAQLDPLAKFKKGMAQDLEKYMKPEANHFHIFIRTIIAVELTRFDHILHVAYNFKPSDGSEKSSQGFALAIASLENTFRLAGQPNTAQWKWFLHSSVQWHTMSTVMVHLSTRPWGLVSEMAWGLAKKAFGLLFEGFSRDPMRQPLPELMRSVARHREVQIQKLQEESSWARLSASFGSILPPMSRLREFSDGRECFDTTAIEERLSLDGTTVTTQPQGSSSNLAQSFRGSELDLSYSSIGTDEHDVLSFTQCIHAEDVAAMNWDAEQHLDLNIFDGEPSQDILRQEPWELDIEPSVANGHRAAWLE
ncbi:hypothetical protein F4808DRAFT_57534 [Astrocystis sublimbata]|nr:hypothetical protein F4808DRAFT_57534 [Astrocystis sublimbata]